MNTRLIYLLFFFMATDIFSLEIHLPTKISDLNSIDGFVSINTRDLNGKCVFSISRDFGVGNNKEIDFLMSLNNNQHFLSRECEVLFLLPYDVSLLKENGKYFEGSSLIPASYLAIYHLMYLSLQQNSYAAQMLLCNSEDILNTKNIDGKIYFNVGIAEIYSVESLYLLYMYYEEVGTLIKNLDIKKRNTLIKDFSLVFEIGDLCENGDYLFDQLKKLQAKKDMSDFVLSVKNEYFSRCTKNGAR